MPESWCLVPWRSDSRLAPEPRPVVGLFGSSDEARSNIHRIRGVGIAAPEIGFLRKNLRFRIEIREFPMESGVSAGTGAGR